MDAMEADASTPSMAGPSRSPTPPEVPRLPAQPAFFYPGAHNTAHQIREGEILSPDQDPFATRGIPVFKPTYDEFRDFEKYMERVEPWGRKSGIVKIIPPDEWSNALPPVNPLLPNLRLRNPIEQHMFGQSGLFRQSNIEKRRTLTLKDWAELCNKPELRANPIKNGEVQTRGLRGTPKKPTRRARKAKGVKEDDVDRDTALPDGDDQPREPTKAPTPSAAGSRHPTPQGNPQEDTREDAEQPSESTAAATPEVKEDPFFASFDPKSSWLPEDTHPEDYTPEACRELERIFWRSCGLGTPPLYGADMAGSLFNDETKEWNVANLPSFLSRLCKSKAIPGVNTPYLYFGMWRATFAWHVEDMDLYSINYIHWGAPKYWYAIPSGRSKAFEGVMKGFFPGDATGCPQYLRHKSFLASPTLLAGSSCRPNTLVQHQGEFVVTYPRGYHAGFNLGLNCAESVNFALESWIELGRKAGVCTCVGDSVRIDVDALLNSAEEHRDEEHAAAEMERKRKRDDESKGEDANNPPKRIKKITIKFDPLNAAPSVVETPGNQEHRPRLRLPPMPPTPCCLCASSSMEGLLRVNDPPQPSAAARPFTTTDAKGNAVTLWRAHEKCAKVLPDTWVDEVDGEKIVFGVDSIDKDRWALRCSICTRTTLKMHGAKIQCQKGKCAKAYHVSCAATSTDMVYRELGEVEQRVFMMAKKSSEVLDQATLAPAGDAEPESTGKVVKIVQKIHIETLCALHNPVAVERKKQAKADQMRQDALALQPESRIKIRATSGVYEVMVISVDSVRETVTVAWGKHRRDFSWKTVIWGDVAPGTVVKQADEVVVATIPSTSGPPSGEGPKLHAKPNQDATPPIPGTHPKSSVLVSKPAPSVYGYPYPQYPVPLHPQAIPYGSAYPYYPPPTAYTVPPPPALVPGQTPAASKSAEASKAAPQAPQWPPYNPAYYQAYPHAGAYYPPYAPYGHPHYYPPYAHFNGVPVPGQPASASLKPSPTPPTLPPSLTSPIPPSAAASVPASESS